MRTLSWTAFIVSSFFLLHHFCLSKSRLQGPLKYKKIETRGDLQIDPLHENQICITRIRTSSPPILFIPESFRNVIIHKKSRALTSSVRNDFYAQDKQNAKSRNSVSKAPPSILQPCDLSSCCLCKRSHRFCPESRKLSFNLFDP